VALATLVAACSPQQTQDTTPTPESTTTSLAEKISDTSTTTTEPPTTTQTPIAPIDVGGTVDRALAATLSEALTAINDPRAEGPVLDGLVAAMAPIRGSLAGSYEADLAAADLPSGDRIGVVRLDSDDVLLVADEGSGWVVVGADLSSVDADPWYGESPRRVLVLGSDARPGGDAKVHRMDSIHILTTVPEQEAGTILGYPRDSWVNTEYGSMRLNALTSSGRGPDAILDHFTEAWELPLEGYILTGFAGFEDLIAATIGRLEITIPIPIPRQKEFPGFRSGDQTLNPDRTLDFSRTRKLIPGGDFTRSFHHGVVMLATLTMLQRGTVDDVPMLLEALSRFTDTNLTASDLIQLGAAAMEMDIAQITNEVLPGSLGRAGGGQSVVLLDPSYEGIVADVIDDGLRNNSQG
jgi:anionic cell wall polymer biosynthesis LytR-Cps2A-Psr (LCP) family protein